MNREWIDNAFWETPKKNILNAICEFDEGGRRVRQVMKMRRYDDNGDENPDFFECLNYLGEEKIEFRLMKDVNVKLPNSNLKRTVNSKNNVQENLRSCLSIN